RPARLVVAGVRLELHALNPAALEGMFEQEELRLDVRPRAPGGAAKPGPADLDPAVLRKVVQVPSRSDRLTIDADREWHVGRGKRLVEVPVEVARPRHEPEDLGA